MFGMGIRTLAKWQVYIGWRNLFVSVRIEVWVSSETNSSCFFIWWFTALSVWFPSFEQWGIDLFGMAYNCRVYTRLECSFLMIYYAGGLMCCSWKFYYPLECWFILTGFILNTFLHIRPSLSRITPSCIVPVVYPNNFPLFGLPFAINLQAASEQFFK